MNFVGNQFLTGACFPQNEHRSIGGRDEINLDDHLPQRVAFPDQIPERLGLDHFLL